MTAPNTVIDLVDRYQRNAADYTSASYKETQVRREFIDPFFEALGWDINNRQGHSEAYKDVIHEDAIKIDGKTNAPDYAFRIGGARKFFLEAKKPSIRIKDDIGPAYQLRRYAWSANLPLSILTDFEELAVYDCRLRPVQNDRAATARVLYFTYAEYAEVWDELVSIFSREAILKGSFDEYVKSSKAKRGTAEVDTAFLKEIESWRDILAGNLALRNPTLTQRELNFAVGRTIDRIIFLRICEDRGIEEYGQLRALQYSPEVYSSLCDIFHRADERYNSGLFHFRQEKGRPESPDQLTLGLRFDDKPLKNILRNLYYPESPYEFSVFSADILGQVYEQFLGRVIRLTPRHRAVVEHKPEVKKTGGVYYTPTYIVAYIVKNTVGQLLEGKTRKQVARLKILDPACGSGSFLIGAYQYLLDWHYAFYVGNNPEKWATGRLPTLYQSGPGVWRLTTSERKRILLNNIYGVDIDPQAVEVTKLSLLLKVLEGENEQTLNTQFQLFRERALPDLRYNIRCGNSLIDSEFYKNKQIPLLGEADRYRINVFDWNDEFPAAMQSGGFDAVIGNPPYIRIQSLKEWMPLEVEFYKRRYSTALKGNYDIYVVFVERGLELLSKQGQMGFILPSKFFSTDYGQALRSLIVNRNALTKVVDFKDGQVFEKVSTYTCLMFLAGRPASVVSYEKVLHPTTLPTNSSITQTIASHTLTASPWVFATDMEKRLTDKIIKNSIPLIDIPSRIARGSSSGSDDIFILQRRGDSFFTRRGEPVEIESDILRIPLYSTDCGRYSFDSRSEEAIIFPYHVTTEGYALLPETEVQTKFPLAYSYLTGRKRALKARKQFKAWYGFSAPRSLAVHDAAHILVPLLADRGLYCYVPEETTKFCLMASAGFSITVDPVSGLSPQYVLGLLNSKLLFWRLRFISNLFRGGWITCTKQYVGTLPIYAINLAEPAERARCRQIEGLVEQILLLHRQMATVTVGHDRTAIQRQIRATDRQIDSLVYEIYQLTDREIALLEDDD